MSNLPFILPFALYGDGAGASCLYEGFYTHPPITPPLGNILPHIGIFVKIECTIFLLAMLGIIGFDALLIFLLQ